MTLVDSSTLALYKTQILSNRVGIWLPSDLQLVTEDLKTVVAPITEVYVSSSVVMKEATFTDNGNRKGNPEDGSVAGDLVSFDSTIIYKDENTNPNVKLTCGGGQACSGYMEVTYQPLACAGNAPTAFLAGDEAWIVATHQVHTSVSFQPISAQVPTLAR